jgi:hypothetical protein
MRSFLMKGGPGPLALVTTAGLGSAMLMPPTAPVALDAAHENAAHVARCSVCTLPLYGRGGETSILGPNPHASLD